MTSLGTNFENFMCFFLKRFLSRNEIDSDENFESDFEDEEEDLDEGSNSDLENNIDEENVELVNDQNNNEIQIKNQKAKKSKRENENVEYSTRKKFFKI